MLLLEQVERSKIKGDDKQLLNLETIFILVAIAAFSIAISFMIILGVGMSVYGYNLTKEDIKEGNLLQLCVTAGWYIEDCWDMYGGINTKYGEPLQ